MSQINGVNGNNALASEEMDDDPWGQVDELLEDPELELDEPSASAYQKDNSLSSKIKQLESRLSTYKLDPAKEKVYENILEEALQEVRTADLFEAENKKGQAAALEKDAEEKYELVLKDLGDKGGTGKENDQSPEVLNSDHKDQDTAVSDVDSSKGIASYKSNPEVTLHNYYNDDGVKTYDIKDVETVTLFPATPSDLFVVTFDEGKNQFKVSVAPGKNQSQAKTYYVDPTSLNKIRIASSKVDTSQLNKEQRDKVQVGLDEAADEKAKKLEIINAAVWPSKGLKDYVDFNNLNESHRGGGGTLAYDIVVAGGDGTGGIDECMKTGKWDMMVKYIQNHSDHDWNGAWTQYNDEYSNDAIRKIVTGIYRASGATSEHDPKFMGLLKKIPPEVRYAMRDAVLRNGGELHENHGDQWDSQKTADLIDASIESETGDPKSGQSKAEPTD